ncbi:stage II sporulation protein M [Paenibacillus hamazuiensis]|uniref:stage II sporulation protein M n=1 Tax=Paenibacillus hamazuiensis TaxID=2936508 RepID=UPI00200E5AB5|nr:stage II sporulation protein M [Paenibacillus hamazuiensis]
MEVRSFIRRHRALWDELEELLGQFARRPRSVGASQIDRLTELYRSVSTHLSYMRSESPSDEIVPYLNALTTRAHHTLYQEQFKSSHQLRHYFRTVLPLLLLKRQWFAAAAALLFLFGALSGFFAVLADPANLHAVLPEAIAKGIDAEQIGEGAKSAPHALLSTAIMTNNIRVAILAFVGGITFGIWTVYLLVYNGLIIGALSAFFWQAGKSYTFWAYILPHGVIELTAIFIAGGAGLYMGYAMLVPGPHPRRFSLLRNAKESAQLLLATVPMFVVAGTIEGYVTPSGLSLEMKYGVAVLTLALLALYYFYCRFLRAQNVQNASRDLISK